MYDFVTPENTERINMNFIVFLPLPDLSRLR